MNVDNNETALVEIYLCDLSRTDVYFLEFFKILVAFACQAKDGHQL